MKVEFEAKAYLGNYQSIEDVMAGHEMPLITTGTGKYYDEQGYARIGSVIVIVDIDSKDEIVTNQIAALKTQLQSVRADNQQKENAIVDKIKNLQAITYSPVV